MTMLGEPGSASDNPRSAEDKPVSANDMPGSASNRCRALWERIIVCGNAAGAPRNHSYYLSLNNF